MKESHGLFDELLVKAEQYAESSVELAKLKSAKHIANTTGVLSTHLLVWVAIILAFLMLSIGVSIWLGELIGQYYWGFFIVAGFYLLVALVIKLFKSSLVEKPVQDCVIRNIFKE